MNEKRNARIAIYLLLLTVIGLTIQNVYQSRLIKEQRANIRYLMGWPPEQTTQPTNDGNAGSPS
jgi:hypothetical protein